MTKDNRLFANQISNLFHSLNQTLVVVDDDPTGTQTVFDVPVLGDWTVETIENEFNLKTPIFFILSNTRSMPEKEAKLRANQIGKNLFLASQASGRKFFLISRSDSTLRGHFPSEVMTLAAASGFEDAPILLVPAFFEGGRITENNIHYILENNQKIPVSQTPFANDKNFGYSNSNLLDWVMEKSKGSIVRKKIKSMSLEDIRQNRISEVIEGLNSKEILVINSTDYSDLEKICLQILQLISQGKKMIFRSAASLISALTGIREQRFEKLPDPNEHGGLLIVGSYVPKTSNQIQLLLDADLTSNIEVPVGKVIGNNEKAISLMEDISNAIENNLQLGIHTLIYTSRKLETGLTIAENLAIGEKITEFLVKLVENLKIKPSFILAKGGITSNDIAVKGLSMKKGNTLGQIIPGVPVWELGKDSKFPGLTYIVFPGNVGEEDSLKIVFEKLTQKTTVR